MPVDEDAPEGCAMIELAIAGASGRMGRCTLELASRDARFSITAALTEEGCATCGSTVRLGDCELQIVDRLGTSCDVLIEFTEPAGTMAWLDVCQRLGIAAVIGATGHDEHQLALIRDAARLIPIVKDVNFSRGVRLMIEAAATLAKALGDDYDVEVVEAHHRYKIDAPSGTALAIVDAIQRAAGRAGNAQVVFGRRGDTGKRPTGQIGVHALRLGDAAGQHEILFSGNAETIALRHTVHSRETFARGALDAAAWVVGKEPGLYSMRDVAS
ncbi:MAG: 4-hydroxy-tetrahydrodipicolinate reductase [Phycisphaerae bacterium]